MNKRFKALIVGAITLPIILAGCTQESAADTANLNLTKACENFECARRIVGINAINGEVLFAVEGFCSYETTPRIFEAICLVDRESGAVERTTLGLADNVTFVSTQMRGVGVDLFQPRVIFRPESVVPNFELSTSARLQGDGNG